MIVNELINPKSISVIGASNDKGKPGGKLLSNLLEHGYKGDIYCVNPKEEIVQGKPCYPTVEELPQNDLAIIAVAAKYVEDAVNVLIEQKGTKAFIILSAGFSEVGIEGKKIEKRIAEKVKSIGGTLIGPNCIGVITPSYRGVFAGPIPKYDFRGCDCVSASGATMVFILEVAIPRGLTFSSIYSVGNSAQIGVEEILEYWDETFDWKTSSRVKLLYMEQIHNPEKLLKHARSLVKKGCRIAAIKAGTTAAGSRAVSSHTGALAGSDTATDALFRKAGIVRCHSRVELVYVAGVMMHKELQGDRIAVITHAGGPGVMLTDALSRGGMKVPKIEGIAAQELQMKLFHGSSVSNPIDFLATGTAEQLGMILDYVDNEFENIDGSAVVFGTTGMWDVTNVYDVLHEKMNSCKKPIYPVLPSVVQAAAAVNHFLSLGRINFTDEVSLGNALCKIHSTPKPFPEAEELNINRDLVRLVIDNNESGYLKPDDVQSLLKAAGLSHSQQKLVETKEQAVKVANRIGYPVVMKVVGPVHKSDVGGVRLYVNDAEEVERNYEELMKIEDATGVMIQQMVKGQEVFIGAKREKGFGHVVLCGLGGIYIEVFKDISYALTPISLEEAEYMIRSIKGYDIIKGIRGREGVNESLFKEAIIRVSALLREAPEIAEMDINPLLGTQSYLMAVDARILLTK